MLGLFEFFIFCCIVYYFFNKSRAKDMVDIFRSHVQDAFSFIRHPTANLENDTSDERLTATATNRVAIEKQRRRLVNKENEKQELDRNLYYIKDSPPKLQLQSNALSTLSCRDCVPSRNTERVNSTEDGRDVIDILRVTKYAGWRSNSSIFDWSGWFPILAQCLRLIRYPYTQVSETVIKDPRLKQAIQVSVRRALDERRHESHESGDEDAESDFDEDAEYTRILNEHNARARRLLMDMRSTVSDKLLRLTSLIMYKTLPCFMSGVVAHPSHIEMLKRAKNASPNVPMIFLPLHRSHLDYILVTFILMNNDIRAPIVAAGDNLRIPFFGAALRNLGAFFIKRKIDPVAGKKDIVYRALLHTYLQHALAAGHNVEFFIEGGRTRTGKPCLPKSGVLSVIIDAFMDGTIPDALLVPVSVNYERLVDGNFVYEQLGQKKKPESFKSAVSAIWDVINSKYGIMRIDFTEPYSIRDLVDAFNAKMVDGLDNSRQNGPPPMKRLTHKPSTSSLYGTDVVDEKHRNLVDSIARHVVYDCASATAVMTTNAVAFLLLTRFRDGAPLDILADALDELRNALRGVRNIGFTGSSHDVIMYAAKLLGKKMISVEPRNGKTFIKPITAIPNVIELYYYANSLVSHFVLDAIIISTATKLSQTHEKQNPDKEFKISKRELFEASQTYCDLLKYEFILNKPCQKLENLMEEAFDRLKIQDLLHVPSETFSEDQLWARRQARQNDSDSEDNDLLTDENDVANVSLTHDGHDKRVVLMASIAPYTHTYLAVAQTLYHLRGNGMMESEFLRECVNEITNKVESQECKYGESISTDTMRNCMKMLEKRNVIEVTSATGVRLISLCRDYDSVDGVRGIVEQIQSTVLL